jgi:hypothetical protein
MFHRPGFARPFVVFGKLIPLYESGITPRPAAASPPARPSAPPRRAG